MPRIAIFVNGILPSLESARKLLRSDDFLLGADNGAHLIMQLGFMPHLVVGDLDSLTEDDSAKITAANIKMIKYPTDKNETDLELAIQHALALNPTSIIIVGALGGRTDQTLANISLLADSPLSGMDIRLDDGVEEVFFCRDDVYVNGNIGDTLSLIPWHAEINGVTTHGLKWALNNEVLLPHKTRGISNEMTEEIASIKIKSGLLLVIHRRNS